MKQIADFERDYLMPAPSRNFRGAPRMELRYDAGFAIRNRVLSLTTHWFLDSAFRQIFHAELLRSTAVHQGSAQLLGRMECRRKCPLRKSRGPPDQNTPRSSCEEHPSRTRRRQFG